jgi:hypothetical protein
MPARNAGIFRGTAGSNPVSSSGESTANFPHTASSEAATCRAGCRRQDPHSGARGHVLSLDDRLIGRDTKHEAELSALRHCLLHSRTVFRATKAGALYAMIVFVIGFILGTIRVLLVAPRLGETTAVIIEAPIMLGASWFGCRWCVDRLDVTRNVHARSGMGSVAFLVLMSAEVGLGAVLGRSLVDQLAAYKSPPGAIGLGAQMIFAMFPVIQVLRRFGKPLDQQIPPLCRPAIFGKSDGQRISGK